MIVYFSVLFLILIACYLDKSEKGRFSLVFSLILICLMISLQRGWGGDGNTYYSYFNYYHDEYSSWKDLFEDTRHGEIGFKIVYFLLPTFEATQFLFSTYYCIALFLLFDNFIPRKFWTLYFIFLFTNRPMLMGSLCAIARTGMAVSSFIIGIYLLSKRKRLWYVLILLFASLFHKSSLLFLPFVLIPPRPMKLNVQFVTIALVLLAIVSVVIPSAWSSIVENFLSVNYTLDGYMNYIDKNEAHYSLNLKIPFFVFWGYSIVKSASLTIIEKKQDYIVLKFAFITIILHLLPALGLSGRLYYFLDYAFFSGMMLVLYKIKDKTERSLILISLLFIFGREFFLFWSTPYFHDYWMVYHPFWQ